MKTPIPRERYRLLPQILFLVGVAFGVIAGHYHGVATVYQDMFKRGVTPIAKIEDSKLR